MINTALIKPGMLIPSYKDFCLLLGLQPSRNNAKNNQLQEIQAFINYEQQGNKFLIREVYAVPNWKAVLEKMTTKDVTRILFLKWLLPELEQSSEQYSMQNREEPGVVQIEQRRLLYLLGILNNKGVSRIVEKKDSTLEREFFSALTSKAYYRLLEIFEEFVKNKILLLERGYLIRRGVKTEFSSREESRAIFSIYNEVMTEFGANSLSEIYILGNIGQFYGKISFLLSERLGIGWHEECYVFGGFPQRVRKILESCKGYQICELMLKTASNGKTQERMRKYGQNKWEKYEEQKNIVYNEEWRNVDLPEDFMIQIENFITRYIKLEPVCQQ